MKYIRYRSMIVKYIGNTQAIETLDGKSVLGKGCIEITDNNSSFDYIIEFIDADFEKIQYEKDRIVIYGSPEIIARTTIIQSIVFMLYQKKNVSENIIALHASAVLKNGELVIFTGGKGSGKTSLSYILTMKNDDIKLVANDYIEIKINDDNTFSIVYSDYGSEVTFRSHVLYNLDFDMYKKLMNTEQYIFNNYVKGTAEFIDLSKGPIRCNRLKMYFVGMGKTSKLEVSRKTGKSLLLEIYKELVQYNRGKSVVAIESDRKRISEMYINGGYFFGKKEAEILFSLINEICCSDNVEFEWVRGKGCDIEKYVLQNLDKGALC